MRLEGNVWLRMVLKDEMNIHVPQEQDAKAELMTLSTTKAKMFSPQASKSNLSVVQDSLLASYLMTISKDKIEKEEFFNICMNGDGWTDKFVDGKLWILHKIQHIRKVLKELGKKAQAFTGKGLVSMMLPDDFNYIKKNDASAEEPVVKIYKGVMYEGALNKAMLGASHNSIIQCLYKEYNVDVALEFVNNIQFIAQSWMMHNGFSIGIKDCIPTKTHLIQDSVIKSFVEADSISQTTQHPKIKEAKISMALNKAKDIGMKIAKEGMLNANMTKKLPSVLTEDRKTVPLSSSLENGFVSTIKSGSKGDFFNIAQITGLLAQQNLTGQRIAPVLNKGRRTLPHYKFGELPTELEYESKGFVRNSFMKGLNPREFFFHAMSGREGISDKTVSLTAGCFLVLLFIPRRINSVRTTFNITC
jgi:DNA-directed RNA polymerase beta' subunit